MKGISFFAVLAVLLLFLLVYGLEGRTAGRTSDSPTLVTSTQPEEEMAEPSLTVISAYTDRSVYHSSEILNFSINVESNSNLWNVTFRVGGVDGRMKEERMVDLKSGVNEVSFTYKLPRCNVCGGIGAGSYGINCEISYGNVSINKSTTVDIQQ
ncbi:MAG: hypothetical protein V1703_00300 [Candidatus Altiarchaeota archaeon]